MTNKQYSPVTQAVSDAIEKEYLLYEPLHPGDAEKIVATAIREVVYQLQYYNFGEGEDMILDARAILDVADELEGK